MNDLDRARPLVRPRGAQELLDEERVLSVKLLKAAQRRTARLSPEEVVSVQGAVEELDTAKDGYQPA